MAVMGLCRGILRAVCVIYIVFPLQIASDTLLLSGFVLQAIPPNPPKHEDIITFVSLIIALRF